MAAARAERGPDAFPRSSSAIGEFPRLHARDAPGLEENPVHLAEQAKRKREALADASNAVLNRRNVVRHLSDIVRLDRWRHAVFKQQQLRQRGLRTLDLGRK